MRKIDLVRTFSPKVTEIQRTWFVVDADGLVLGRLASSVAAILRGKHRPYFAPHVDTGDHVIVVNADKVVLTSGKADAKMAYRHSGYPGGLRSTSYAELLADKPAELIRRSVRGMLPKNTPRPPDARQAAGLRRPRASPLRPEARAARAARRPPGRLSTRPRLIDRRDITHAMPVPLSQTTGRRKQAVARVRFRPGQGAITVNKLPIEKYFTSATHRMLVTEPLRVTNTVESYDIEATIDGGGTSGQAGAMRLGIARSLCEMDPELRSRSSARASSPATHGRRNRRSTA